MPSLRDLHCFIELSVPQKRLREFGTSYGDGSVETFVAVPRDPESFAVRLGSSSFIAPGLAMFVFIDGEYQCNRNRQNLKLRNPPERRSVVDFCVRQKEERQQDGSMIARDWRFEKLNIAGADQRPTTCSSRTEENIGCIEVVVLRSAGMRGAKPTPARSKGDSKSKAMNLDGAADNLDHPFGMDGQPHGWDEHYKKSQHDDRAWHRLQDTQPYSVHGSTSRRSTSSSRPPPPLSMSHGGTIPDRTSLSAIPPYGYQYGSGPIPHRTRVETIPAPPPSIVPPKSQNFDPQWLGHLATVKRSVKESQHDNIIRQAQVQGLPPPPGAWPASHFGLCSSTNEVSNHISWNLPTRPGKLDEASSMDGWSSRESSSTDRWDADDSWGTKQDEKGWTSYGKTSRRSRTSNAWTPSKSRPATPTNRSVNTRSWKSNKGNRTVKPHLAEPVWESSADKDSWTHIDATSEVESAWSTVRPSSSVSAFVPPLSHATAPSTYDQKSRLQPCLTTEVSSATRGDYGPRRHSNTKSFCTTGPFGITFEEFMRATAVDDDLDNKTVFGSWEKSNEKDKRRDMEGNSWSKGDKPKEQVGSDCGWEAVINGWGPSAETKDAGNGWTAEKLEANGEKVDFCDITWGDKWETYNSANPWTTPTSPRLKPTKNKTSKSRHTKKHKKRPTSTPADSTPATHWHFPPSPSDNKMFPIPEHWDSSIPEHPPHTISKAKAKEKGISHKVRAGTATPYGHAIARPEYIDSLDKPYAVFRFKYRSHSFLRKVFGDEVPDVPLVPLGDETTPRSSEKMKQKLRGLSQDALIESLLELRKKGARGKERESLETDEVGRDRTKDWVRQHSREVSEKGRWKGEGGTNVDDGGWGAAGWG